MGCDEQVAFNQEQGPIFQVLSFVLSCPLPFFMFLRNVFAYMWQHLVPWKLLWVCRWNLCRSHLNSGLFHLLMEWLQKESTSPKRTSYTIGLMKNLWQNQPLKLFKSNNVWDSLCDYSNFNGGMLLTYNFGGGFKCFYMFTHFHLPTFGLSSSISKTKLSKLYALLHSFHLISTPFTWHLITCFCKQ